MDPTDTALSKMRQEYMSHKILASCDFSELVEYVIDHTNVEKIDQQLDTLILTGEKEIDRLSYVVLDENDVCSHLLYLGDRKFYVLTTSRTTIIPGDVLEYRESVIRPATDLSFNLYRDGKRFKPEKSDLDYSFVIRGGVTRIHRFTSPELYNIIDNEPRFGQCTLAKLNGDVQKNITALEKIIRNTLDKWEKEHPDDPALPENDIFPDYDQILALAKSSGIPCFVLNMMIEACENNRHPSGYSYVAGDWDSNLTPEQKAEIEKKRQEKARRDYREYTKSLTDELKKVQRRRKLIIFDAPGIITPESQVVLDGIVKKLNELYDEFGLGKKGEAENKIADAKRNSEPRPGHNLKMGVYILISILAALFIGVSWYMAKESSVRFDERLEDVRTLVEAENFNGAKDLLVKLKDEFKPSYLAFVVNRRVRNSEIEIELAIDEFVGESVKRSYTLIKAQHQRISEENWKSIILVALQYRPDDPDLNELRQRYINQ